MTKGISLFAALAVALAPDALVAQLDPLPGGPSSPRWPAPEVGARVGFEGAQRHTVLGGMIHAPVLRSAHAALLPSVDVTFLRGLREYQYNFEVAYFPAGRSGGLYAGGGLGVRSTVLPADPDAGRRTIATYNLVVGLKLTGLGRVSPLVEFRRVFTADLAVDPQPLTVGATLRLW